MSSDLHACTSTTPINTYTEYKTEEVEEKLKMENLNQTHTHTAFQNQSMGNGNRQNEKQFPVSKAISGYGRLIWTKLIV